MNHRPGWTLLVASVAAFMTSLDQMVVTTALPKMRADLGGTVGQLEWTMNAFYLAFACLLLAAAGLGDRFGRRRVLVVGLVVFGLSSLAAAAAPGLGLLIAARVAQGGASAAVLPLTLTVISEAYSPEGRGKAIGIWSSLLGAGGVLGPLVGGVLVEAVGWRGIFWVNVPIAAAVAIATRIVVTESHGPRHRLDLQGLVLATAGSPGGWPGRPTTAGVLHRSGYRLSRASRCWQRSFASSTPAHSRSCLPACSACGASARPTLSASACTPASPAASSSSRSSSRPCSTQAR